MVKNADRAVGHFMQLYRDGRTLPVMLKRLCAYVHWTELGFCRIRDMREQIIPLRLNRMQRVFIGNMMLQAAIEKPIRIVVLKSRKVGITTAGQTCSAFFCAHFRNQRASLMAHLAPSTSEIFDIAKLVFEYYPAGAIPVVDRIAFPGTRSWYTCHTAGGVGAGAGVTPNHLHLSEVALCPPRVKSELYTATNAVPDHSSTVITQESTARGRDSFWNLFDEARNDSEHPYTAVFIPWFMDDRLCVPLTAGEKLEPNDDERLLIAVARDDYGIELPVEAMKWRRLKIKSIEGGLAVFRQEYPSTPEEAVQGHRELYYPGMRQCVISKLPFAIGQVDPQQKIGGMDHAGFDPTVLVKGVYWGQILYVTGCYHSQGKLARDHARHIDEEHLYFCDPSALAGRMEMVAAARDIGRDASMVPCPRISNKGRINPVVDTEIGIVQKLIVDGRLKILDTAADRIVLEAENYSRNPKTGKPDDTRSEIWGHFDTLDALRYMAAGAVSMGTGRGEVVIVKR